MRKRGAARFFGSDSWRLLAREAMPFFLLLASLGCATTDKKTDGKPAHEEIPFSEILHSPGTHTGKVVRLGGVIVQTENRETETVIEILEKPLNRQGKPKPGDISGGRFRVVFEGFLDNAVYRPNRFVTVIGEIIGVETAAIGEASYDYPLLSGREARLWEEGDHFDRPRMHIGIGIGSGGGGVGIGTSF
jgi:outer membrane lipoprotein